MAAPIAIMTRLGCARVLLANKRGAPEHSTFSKLQHDAIIDLFKLHEGDVCGMNAESKAKMASLASSGSWVPEHLASILDHISPPDTEVATRKPRGKMQRATPEILSYFTQSEWATFRGQGVRLAMSFLIERLVQLGYTRLSEPCKAWCTSLLLHIAGMDSASDPTKQNILIAFKKDYMRKVRMAHRSEFEPPLTLPESVLLQQQCPDLFKSVFRAEQPIPSVINLSEVTLPVVFCRNTSKSFLAFQPTSHPSPPAPTSPMRFLENLIVLQQDNMKLMQNSLSSSRTHSFMRNLEEPPMSSLQEHARRPLALPPLAASLSSASLASSGALGLPRQEGDDAGQAAAPSRSATLVGDEGLGAPWQGEGLGAPRQGEQQERTASFCSGNVFGLGDVDEEAATVRGDERIGLPMQGDQGALAPGAWQYVETQLAESSERLEGGNSAAMALHISSSIPTSPSAVGISSDSSNSQDRLPPNASVVLPPTVGGKLYVDPVGEAMLIAMGMEPPSPEGDAGSAGSSALAIVPHLTTDPSSADGGEGASVSSALVSVSAPQATDVAIVARAPSVAAQLLGELPTLSKAKAEAKSRSAAKSKAAPKATRAKAKAKALLDRAPSKASSASKASSKAGAPAAAPKAMPSVAAKRNRAGIQDESTRKTMRARLANGISKGFKYTDDADRGRARAAAEEFMKSNGEEV